MRTALLHDRAVKLSKAKVHVFSDSVTSSINRSMEGEKWSGSRNPMNIVNWSSFFEYQGNASELVRTPLTEKCYFTLIHRMHLGYGGNPYGPDWHKENRVCEGSRCVPRTTSPRFQLQESFDFQAMGRFFICLVQCGAWGCFAEFNRLLEEQMSAISRRMQLIQAAARSVPDKELIAEMRVCRGFQESTDHGSTRCGVVLAVGQLLSMQQHYE